MCDEPSCKIKGVIIVLLLFVCLFVCFCIVGRTSCFVVVGHYIFLQD